MFWFSPGLASRSFLPLTQVLRSLQEPAFLNSHLVGNIGNIVDEEPRMVYVTAKILNKMKSHFLLWHIDD